MIYNEHLKKEYNKIVRKIGSELNSMLFMAAAALLFIDIISFASSSTVYGESVVSHILSTTVIFAVLFLIALVAKQIVMYFIRIKVRELLIEEKASEIAKNYIYPEHILSENRSASA